MGMHPDIGLPIPPSAGPHQAEPNRHSRVQKGATLSRNGSHQGAMQGLRHRSHWAVSLWRRWQSGKYAMADGCRSEAKRQVGTSRLHQG